MNIHMIPDIVKFYLLKHDIIIYQYLNSEIFLIIGFYILSHGELSS
jgi:hypothetical protein